MASWHRSWKADIGLRISGLILCGLAYLALTCLIAMQVAPRTAGALAYALATVGFFSASAGTALAMLGKHLFDEVQVSTRWRRSYKARPQDYLSDFRER
ncbi:hypothetical protein KCP91_15490 [Microvirga sp. SRT01]|uniref:Uncharacterized protein n=1 Tax=Sphingomonas longa TaxID=2778730 RepID=A0ABS2DCI2_9SPHN|nr:MULTISPECIES: hypothetical protein [Alphaproteobacteria]MBM6577786.1 hypothetical protein [Sphingomonas sp. BT552]MBR7710828.1 hypothetical protein [Microvirga sp. SRT01]